MDRHAALAMTRGLTLAAALLAAALLAAALLAASAARAQQIDFSHGGPLSVTAEAGMELQQEQQRIVATGNAKAVRDNVTVTADTLIAYYRKKAPAPGAQTPAAPAPGAKPAGTALPGESDTGANEVYRVEAIGRVHIDTPTDHATAEHAVYDMDQAVLLMTGNNLKITTPTQIITARDAMEYWSQLHMSVARGNAVVVTNDAKRVSADVLVAYSASNSEPGAPPAPRVQPAAANGAPQDPIAASGKLKKVDAFGNVSVRNTTDTVTGDRAVYVPDTGIARVGGHVRITRGQNQLDGQEAEVNLKTGISRLLPSPNARVEGYVVPSDANPQANGAATPAAPKTKKTEP
jgi:lipopolysaccharide export system protein LptA